VQSPSQSRANVTAMGYDHDADQSASNVLARSFGGQRPRLLGVVAQQCADESATVYDLSD
jgi:hypothetical protein